jgi:capsular exopolysaccharide synthesis family protein
MVQETYAASRSATLRRGLAVVRRRLPVLVLATLAVPAIAYGVSKAQDPEFEGTATVLATFKEPAVGEPADDVFNRDDAQRFAATQSGIARSPALAAQVVAELGRSEEPSDFLDDSAVAPRTGSDLIDFRVRDGDEEQAQRAAEVYAREFVTYRSRLEEQSLDRAGAELSARMRELDARGQHESELYEQLNERRQRIRTLAALPDTSVQFVARADSAETVAPRTTRNVILGLALGLLIGLALAFVREALDTRVRNGDEIVDALGLPLLGRVGRPAKRRRGAGRPAVLEAPGGRDAETFRKLRTNLQFAAIDEPFRTVQIASALEGEGKSTTAANLAVSLARGGQRVALVDLDLHRPAIAKAFGLSGAGVSDVALGRAELDAALTEVPVGDGDLADGRLVVLPAGSVPSDAGELVASSSVGEVLSALARDNDVVLVDAPPWVEAGDGAALSARLDAVIVVTRIGVVRRSALAELREALAASPARKLGIVVTGADREDEVGYAYGDVRIPEARPLSERGTPSARA